MSAGSPISTDGWSVPRSNGSRSSSSSTSIRIIASASPLPVTRRTASGPSSPVSSRTSYPCVRALVATAMAISIITGTYMSVRSGTISAMMLERLLARARAPAFGW